MKKQQHLVLSTSGKILKSCETLFPANKINPTDAPNLFVIFENVFPSIQEALQHEKMVYLKAINAPASFLPGIYDLVYSKQKTVTAGVETKIDCWITERTGFYEDIRYYKQYTNEAAL